MMKYQISLQVRMMHSIKDSSFWPASLALLSCMPTHPLSVADLLLDLENCCIQQTTKKVSLSKPLQIFACAWSASKLLKLLSNTNSRHSQTVFQELYFFSTELSFFTLFTSHNFPIKTTVAMYIFQSLPLPHCSPWCILATVGRLAIIMIRAFFMFHIWFSKPGLDSASLLTNCRALCTIVKLCVIHGFFKNSIAFNLLKSFAQEESWNPSWNSKMAATRLLVCCDHQSHSCHEDQCCTCWWCRTHMHAFWYRSGITSSFAAAEKTKTIFRMQKQELDFISLVYHACLSGKQTAFWPTILCVLDAIHHLLV